MSEPSKNPYGDAGAIEGSNDALSFKLQDPNYTQPAETGQFRGGRTKIRPTDLSGLSGKPTGASASESIPSQYPESSGKLAWNGNAPSGENSSGIPTARGSEAMANYAGKGANTLYDENHTAVDVDDAGMYSGVSPEGH